MRKLFSLFAALTLCAGLWAETVSYRHPTYIDDDVTKGIDMWYDDVADATPITSSSSTWGDGGMTWLVVNSDVTISERITCDGEVHLILADGAKLTAEQGITVSGEGNSLTIYAQSTNPETMGQLIADATSVESAAGIGGGGYEENGSNITINGGIITTAGGYKASGIGGGEDGPGSDITINGGIVAATGGEGAAGIGGGGNGGSGSNITINGGEVTANGASNAAGIGGGENGGSGSYITINGGEVEATGGEGAAGIGGGGNGGYGSNITINGGIITTAGGYSASGIGGGEYGDGSNITINGGKVRATGGYSASGIGGGANAFGSDIFVATSLQVKADGNNPPTTVITNTGADLASSLAGKRYATVGPPTPVSTTYLDENGETKNISAWEVKDASEAVTWGTAGQTTWYVVKGTNVQLSKGAICAGDVRLILADGAKLTATGWFDETDWIGYAGIQVSGDGNSLTIYAQSTGTQMGQLIATGGPSTAGIGGGSGGPGSYITILAGTVTATGVDGGAGIGGGYAGSGSNIVINGGIIEANGGDDAAGIGGGEDGIGSNITINGGIITANGGDNGAGIGGGYEGSGSDITINGGEVTATGVDSGAGIGGGMFGYGSNITILAGTVEATGGMFAAGIGGGNEMFGSDITINGGTVTAYGGGSAAGIGGGNNGYGSNITILAGTVTATSEYAGAGIGGGQSGAGANITINGGEVTANGGEMAACIGGGYEGVCSDIYISDAYVLKAGSAAEPTDVIAHSSAQDLGGTLTQQYAKVQGLATPYTRSMTIDNWATVCLPYDATSFSGADFYKVNYYDASNPSDLKLYIEPVDNLVAGMPYIFQATADVVTIEHAGVATLTYGEEQKDRGLQGLFARTIIATDGSQAALSNNAVQWLESDLEITVPACRAYFDMNNVPDFEQTHSAPLRCIRVPRQTPTDFENVTLDEDATKILRNGQLIIIRDGKEYNAQGMQL